MVLRFGLLLGHGLSRDISVCFEIRFFRRYLCANFMEHGMHRAMVQGAELENP